MRIRLSPLRCAIPWQVRIDIGRYRFVIQPPILSWMSGRSWCSPWVALTPNSTPWAATWICGNPDRCLSADDLRMIRVRRALWGHGYDCQRLDPQLLEAAVAVVEERTLDALNRFEQMFNDRANWVAVEEVE